MSNNIKHTTEKKFFKRQHSQEAEIYKKCMLLTNKGPITAKHWIEYLRDNWDIFRRELSDINLLIICGVHGGKDGKYFGDTFNVETCKLQVVSHTTFT